MFKYIEVESEGITTREEAEAEVQRRLALAQELPYSTEAAAKVVDPLLCGLTDESVDDAVSGMQAFIDSDTEEWTPGIVCDHDPITIDEHNSVLEVPASVA